MKKFLLFVSLYFFSSSVSAISTTDKLVADDTNFYNQTSGAELVSCSIEFFGMDSKFNVLNGSFGLNYFETENKVALMFKLQHYEINSDGSIKFSHPVKDAFFELNDYLSKDLIQVKNDNESILSIGDTMNFITAGFVSEDNIQSFKIIVNYEGKILDKVFEFSSLNYNKILEMMSCSMKMLDK